MKDVSLDDLIKQDKQKLKQKRQNRSSGKFDRRGRGRGGFVRRGSKGNFRRDQSRDDRPQRKDKGGRVPVRRPITKGRDRDVPKNIKGRRIIRDRPRESQGKRQPQKRQKQPKQDKQQAPKQQKGRTLKVLGLHPDITNQDLYKLFAVEGALEKCMIQQDNFGRNLPSALVKYYTAQTAKKAIQNINAKKVLNSVLTVEPYRNRK